MIIERYFLRVVSCAAKAAESWAARRSGALDRAARRARERRWAQIPRVWKLVGGQVVASEFSAVKRVMMLHPEAECWCREHSQRFFVGACCVAEVLPDPHGWDLYAEAMESYSQGDLGAEPPILGDFPYRIFWGGEK